MDSRQKKKNKNKSRISANSPKVVWNWHQDQEYRVCYLVIEHWVVMIKINDTKNMLLCSLNFTISNVYLFIMSYVTDYECVSHSHFTKIDSFSFGVGTREDSTFRNDFIIFCASFIFYFEIHPRKALQIGFPPHIRHNHFFFSWQMTKIRLVKATFIVNTWNEKGKKRE